MLQVDAQEFFFESEERGKVDVGKKVTTTLKKRQTKCKMKKKSKKNKKKWEKNHYTYDYNTQIPFIHNPFAFVFLTFSVECFFI